MLSKKQNGFIRSLHQKKFRQMYGKFLVEGDKPVQELLASDFKVYSLISVEGWQPEDSSKDIEHFTVSTEELKKLSTLENPKEVIAVAGIPNTELFSSNFERPKGLVICLDNLNDPGNAGTIIRLADWFGLPAVYFSQNSVDIYNPKVVSAAKGSLFRVHCQYTDLKKLFEQHPQIPVYGTFMEGENMYDAELAKDAFIIIGNEANGVGEELFPYLTKRITIPSFGKAESLNAGVATGIVLSEWKRRLS